MSEQKKTKRNKTAYHETAEHKDAHVTTNKESLNNTESEEESLSKSESEEESLSKSESEEESLSKSESEEEKKYLFDFNQFYLLMILYEGEIHGYGLKKKFKTQTGKDISYSSVYPFLNKLLDKGYLDKIEEDVGKKKKIVYKLTHTGRKFCERLFRRFSSMIQNVLSPDIEICEGCGIKVYQGGYKEEINGEVHTFCCSHCAEAYKYELNHLDDKDPDRYMHNHDHHAHMED